MKLPIQNCPYCGSTEFVVGFQPAEVLVTYKRNGIMGNHVKYLICKQCGMIVGAKVAEPWRFQDARVAWEP